MKIRKCFVSNSSSSSFILSHFDKYSDTLEIYKFFNENGSLSPEERKLWIHIFGELKEDFVPSQEDYHSVISTKEVPKTWDTYSHFIKTHGFLLARVPIEFLEIRTISKYAKAFMKEIMDIIEDEI